MNIPLHKFQTKTNIFLYLKQPQPSKKSQQTFIQLTLDFLSCDSSTYLILAPAYFSHSAKSFYSLNQQSIKTKSKSLLKTPPP